MERQQAFVECLSDYLESRGFAARTLGVTDYDIDAPLKAIRRLLLESNGIIAIAFRRTYLKEAAGNYATDMSSRQSYDLSGTWFTSPWAHIEPAMAYQLGLPIMILRERNVVADGLLEKGIVGTYLPEFDVEAAPDAYLRSPEWNQIVAKWEAQVRSVVDRKGNPPQLF
jgi:hypothetical protein